MRKEENVRTEFVLLGTKNKPRKQNRLCKIYHRIRRKIKDKIQIAHKNKPKSKETKHKMSLKKIKSIIQYDLNGNLIKEWNSIIEAKSWLGKGDIQSCVLGKSKTSGGFIWKYKNK